MAKHLVTDDLWVLVESELPEHRGPTSRGGRPPKDDRLCLEGILFVLKTGISWEDLPPQFGVSGMTCWRRLRDWQKAGVWDRIHAILLSCLREADQIDFSRVTVDSASVRALKGGIEPGPVLSIDDAPARSITC